MKKLSIKSLLKEVETQTMVPPAQGGGKLTPQQQMLQRRKQMNKHRKVLDQSLDAVHNISKLSDSIRMSLGSSKTRKASQDLQELMTLVSELQQMVSQVPQLESKIVNEDHNDKKEKFVVKILDNVNQRLFNSNVAIKGGNYQSALNDMSLSVQQLRKGMEVLQQHIQDVAGEEEDVFFPVD